MADNAEAGQPRVADAVVFRELDGEAVLLNLNSGIYFGLDATGTRIWRALDRRDTIDVIVADLVREYDVDAGTARRDVIRLIAELTAKGLLVVTADGTR